MIFFLKRIKMFCYIQNCLSFVNYKKEFYIITFIFWYYYWMALNVIYIQIFPQKSTERWTLYRIESLEYSRIFAIFVMVSISGCVGVPVYMLSLLYMWRHTHTHRHTHTIQCNRCDEGWVWFCLLPLPLLWDI